MISEKQLAAEAAVEYIKDGMIVGLGTGSTTEFALKKLGEKVRNGLAIKGIPTSVVTKKLAEEEAIPLIDFSETMYIDITIDGADEIDKDLNMKTLDKVFQIIIKSAIFEFLYKPKTSIKIIIKEYLNASNFFIEESQTKYLNALLDKISKKIRISNG